jgi:uncharacterized protein (DUF736 family)
VVFALNLIASQIPISLGAGWNRTKKDADKPCVSVKLDGPLVPAPGDENGTRRWEYKKKPSLADNQSKQGS